MIKGRYETKLWETFMESGREAFLDGHYNLAATLIHASLLMAQNSGTVIDANVGQLLMLYGDLQWQLSDYYGAEALYRRAAVIFADLSGQNHVDVCIAIMRISELCRIQGKQPEALFFKRESEKLLRAKRLALSQLLNVEMATPI